MEKLSVRNNVKVIKQGKLKQKEEFCNDFATICHHDL